MSKWTVWDPGAGAWGSVSSLTSTIPSLASGFGTASSQMRTAVGSAQKMASQALSTWTDKASGISTDLGTARDRLVSLESAFSTYNDSLASIARQAQSKQDLLWGTARTWAESMLGAQSRMSDSQAEGVVERVRAKMDPSLAGSNQGLQCQAPSAQWTNVSEAVLGLAQLSRERDDADNRFVSEVKQVLDNSNGLFGVTPDEPPGSPRMDDSPALAASLAAGALNAGLDGARAGFGAWRTQTSDITHNTVRAGDGAEWTGAGEKAGAVFGGLASLLGLGEDIYDAARGDSGRSGGEIATSMVSNAAGLGDAARTMYTVKTAGGLATAVKEATTPAGRLLPGLGTLAGVAGAVSSGIAAANAFKQGDVGAGIGNTVSGIGSAVSAVGSCILPPAGLVVQGIGAGLNVLGGLISHFWGKKK